LKFTVTVLTDAKGDYHIKNLPAAIYSVQVSSVGYQGDPHSGLVLTAAQNASVDFALQVGTVRWKVLGSFADWRDSAGFPNSPVSPHNWLGR
jgi:hypothetical protein